MRENGENEGKWGKRRKARESEGEVVVCMYVGKSENFARTVRRS